MRVSASTLRFPVPTFQGPDGAPQDSRSAVPQDLEFERISDEELCGVVVWASSPGEIDPQLSPASVDVTVGESSFSVAIYR